MKFYAVYEKEWDYIKYVLSEKQYDEEYGHLHYNHHPRYRVFNTRQEAQEFAREQSARAMEKYLPGSL